MQFSYGRTKFKNDDTLRRKAIGNFLGVAYARPRLDVADYRASDMENLIQKDGVNHNRPGWNEAIKHAWTTASDIDNIVPTRSFVIYAVLVNEVFHIRSSIIVDIQPGTCIVHAQEITDRLTTNGIVVFKFRSSI